MTHVAIQLAGKTLKEQIETGQISRNALVTGYPGHPCPTLAALVSAGIIDVSKMANSISFSGWGGE